MHLMSHACSRHNTKTTRKLSMKLVARYAISSFVVEPHAPQRAASGSCCHQARSGSCWAHRPQSRAPPCRGVCSRWGSPSCARPVWHNMMRTKIRHKRHHTSSMMHNASAPCARGEDHPRSGLSNGPSPTVTYFHAVVEIWVGSGVLTAQARHTTNRTTETTVIAGDCLGSCSWLDDHGDSTWL